MKKIIDFQDILELNKKLQADGLDFRIHLQDSCGAQTCRIERLENGGCEDQDEAMRRVLECYFAERKWEIEFSGTDYFFVKQ